MPNYKVTLNFNVRVHSPEDGWGEDEDEQTKKNEAFARTEAFYKENNMETYIKTFDAMGLVEYVYCEGEVLSAEWDPENFQIHMVISSDETPKEVTSSLRMNSLEDGEYEGCGESGWIIMTRGKNNEVYYGDWDRISEFWEYALLDYRSNPIKVERIEEAVAEPVPVATAAPAPLMV